MILPALTLDDVDGMSPAEVEKRIKFLNKNKQDSKKLELRNFVSIMHLAISAGSSPSKKSNKLFYRQLGKIFDDKKDDRNDDEDLEEIMNLANTRNVEK